MAAAAPGLERGVRGGRRAGWFAPGRVNLIGEHTDYNCGLALPVAIQPGCRCSVEPQARRSVTIHSGQTGMTVEVDLDRLQPKMAWGQGEAWAAYVAGAVWAVGRHLGRGHRLGSIIDIDSDLPMGAGLASSAALCCSVAGAVLDSVGEEPSPALVADMAIAAEAEFVGAATGRLDQLAVTRGEAGRAMLCDFRDDSVEQIPLPLAESGLAVVVVDTGVPHAHLAGGYADRREACRLACTELGIASLREAGPRELDRIESPTIRRRARHVLTENDRVADVCRLLRAGKVTEVGPLLTASHESMRLDYEITVPRVDVAVAALIEAGALGARMTGGGFGGCVIGLLPVGRADEAVSGLRRRSGDPGLWALRMEASGGARRLTG